MTEGELLTPEEKLAHGKRWTGSVTSLKEGLRNMAKTHWPNNIDIDEDESWNDFLDELVDLIGQLRTAELK